MKREDKLIILSIVSFFLLLLVVYIGIIIPANKIAEHYPPEVRELINAEKAEYPHYELIYFPLLGMRVFAVDETPFLPKIGLALYPFTEELPYPIKLIEQINNSTFRIIVGDSLTSLPCKYLTFNFTISLRNKKHEGYFTTIRAEKGRWVYTSIINKSRGNLTVYLVKLKSDDDKQIIKKITKRILTIAKKYKINRSRLLKLTMVSVLDLITPYENRWRDIHDQTIEIRVFNRTAKRFEMIRIRNPDTDLKWVLLKGGVCWDYSVVTALLLNELGIKTYVIVYISPKVAHGVIGILENHSNVKIQYDNKTVYLKVIDPQRGFVPDYAPIVFDKENKVIIYEIENFTNKTQR